MELFVAADQEERNILKIGAKQGLFYIFTKNRSLFNLCKGYASRRSSLVSKSLPIKNIFFVTCLFLDRKAESYVLLCGSRLAY